MARGQGRRADDMNIIFDCHFRGLCRCLKHGTDIDVKTDIRKSGCHHLDTPVVPVLPHLGHKNSGPAALFFLESVRAPAQGFYGVAASVFGSIYTGNTLGRCHKPAEHLFHGVRYFAHRRPGPYRRYARFEQIAAGFGHGGYSCKGPGHSVTVTCGFEFLQFLDLLVTHRLGDFQKTFKRLFLYLVFVHADNHIQSLVDPGLFARGRFFNPHFGHTGLDCLGHPAEFFNFVYNFARFGDDAVCQGFYVIGTT